MIRYSISVLTYTALAQAKRCIESVLKHSGDFELILTANGNQAAAEYFSDLALRFRQIRVRTYPANRGFWFPNNEAFGVSRGEFFVCLNDDTVVYPGWLEALRAPFEKFPDAALSCPEGGCTALQPDFHGTRGAFEYCEGACLMVRAAVARKHGLFDPKLPAPAYGEDSNLSLRYRELGYSIHQVKVHVDHMRACTSRTVPQVKDWAHQNHLYNLRRFAHYMKVRRTDYPILVKRSAALGDVLLATAVVRQIKLERPTCPILFETMCPQVLDGHPDIQRIDAKIPARFETQVLDLNMSYENMPHTHILDAYFKKAAEVLHLEGTNEETWIRRDNTLRNGNRRGVTIHPGPTTWASKNWPAERWVELTQRLMGEGTEVYLVGHGSQPPKMPCTADFRGRATIHQAAGIIGCSQAFAGVDSFPLHVAQAVGTPAVGLFGITDSACIMLRSRAGVGVNSTAPTHGLRHRETGKIVVDDQAQAINAITVDQVYAAVKQFLS